MPESGAREVEEGQGCDTVGGPGSIENVSYFKMPGYSYEGYDYNGMFAWFSFKKPDVRLHVRPPAIQRQPKKDLAAYATTKALVISQQIRRYRSLW